MCVLTCSIAKLKLRDQHTAAARASTPVPFIYIKTDLTHTYSPTHTHKGTFQSAQGNVCKFKRFD